MLEGHVVASVTSLELRRLDGSTRPVLSPTATS